MRSLDEYEAYIRPNSRLIARWCMGYLPADGVFLDIGANVGQVAEEVMLAMPGVAIHAFEPVDAYLRRCVERLTGPDCHVYACGLSDHAHTSPIYLDAENQAINSLIPEIARPGADGQRAQQDACFVTLDSLGLPRVDVMKIDVEGWEGKVWRGGWETILRCRPVMIVELRSGGDPALWTEKCALLEALFALGYQRFRYDDIVEIDVALVPAGRRI